MPIISSVKINHFTVFKDFNINFSKGINVVVGENGTGKTHLLKLIYAKGNSIENGCKVSDSLDNSTRHFNFHDIRSMFEVEAKKCSDLMQCSFHINYNDKACFGNTIFIPANEVLSMSYLTKLSEKYSKETNIDKTFTDIIKNAQAIKPDVPPPLAEKIAPILESIIKGKVVVEDDNTFWVIKDNGEKIPFSLESEGIRKLGLLWQLIMNESITKNTLLIWDLPETSLNPKIIADLVRVVFELSRNGVQIIITTHDYFMPKYIEVLKEEGDDVLFHSLYKYKKAIKCETSDSFDFLDNNSINKKIVDLYKESVKKALK